MQEGEVESTIQEVRFARFLLPLGQKKQITVPEKCNIVPENLPS